MTGTPERHKGAIVQGEGPVEKLASIKKAVQQHLRALRVERVTDPYAICHQRGAEEALERILALPELADVERKPAARPAPVQREWWEQGSAGIGAVPH